MTVSILFPTRNRRAYLEVALASVALLVVLLLITVALWAANRRPGAAVAPSAPR